MQRTNYVDKAKSLMLKTARTTALVIVPLAAAVSAQASTEYPVVNIAVAPTLTLGTASCTPSGNGASGCSGGETQNSGSTLNGVSFYTTSPVLFALSSGGFSSSLALQASGALSGGSLPSSVPVEWNFTLSGSGISGVSWSLLYTLTDLSSGGGSGSFTTSGSGTGTSSGSGTLNFVGNSNLGDTIRESATLRVSGTVPSTGSLSISVPGNGSFDFGTQGNNSVPEPGSVGLVAGGLAFFGALLLRRKK